MDPPRTIERRQHARLALESMPAALLVAGHDLGLHTIVDASEGGVFVCHPAPVVPAGTHVALVLPSSNGRPPLTVSGRVAHVSPAGSARAGYGVEWLSPPEDLFERINELHTARLKPRHIPIATAHPLALSGDVPGAPPSPVPMAPPIPPPLVPPEQMRALVIDNDVVHARGVARVLGTLGLPAVPTTRARDGMDLFEARSAQVVLVLVDFLLPDLSGEELIRRLRRDHPELAIIATTAVLRSPQAQRPLIQAGANRVLAKPFASDALSSAVRAVLA